MTHNAQSSFLADRCAGAILGTACGDALGAPHEFGGPLAFDAVLEMSGGGPFGFAPGEYTDDTAMAIPLARAVAQGKDLRDPHVIAEVLAEWLEWLGVTKDVGVQTGSVLRALRAGGDISERAARELSRAHHEKAGKRSGGNGALMRTAPVALGYLDDPAGLTEAARRIAELTHWEESAGDACVLWCHAIVLAVTTGELDLRPGLDFLPAERATYWSRIIDEAENARPEDFHHENGWVVAALQGAWSAITMGRRAGEGAVGMIERAVRGGGDTDTVAAIAGALAGAAGGASSLPARWRRTLHGWGAGNTILRARDLTNLGVMAARRGVLTEKSGWPLADRFEPDHRLGTLVSHPHDEGVLLSSIDVLDDLPASVDAVVSMCRIGNRQVTDREVIEFWLIDRPGYNLDAEFVLRDAADTIAQLRSEGKVVLLHCWAAHSRTPSAAIAYSVRHLGVELERAYTDVVDALPAAHPNPEFEWALRGLSSATRRWLSLSKP